MGKGSKRRPTLVDEDTFAERWERAFGLAAEEDERARAWDEPPPCDGYTHDSVCGCGCNDGEDESWGVGPVDPSSYEEYNSV